ncbi:FliI/YscN family ATPase [Paraburkholderia sp. J10-1]|uniref:FliI/YscN family ATPase n=1 Tax=Paraburkholderia sp. J10-1 TaxID=2805430 RepID=UPI002AB5DEB1|nr:FliI/YscN family ATPase [Paraburkholderia sp. J10-1]
MSLSASTTPHRLVNAVRNAEVLMRTGAVTRVMPTFVEADGPRVPPGTICEIGVSVPALLGEVVQVSKDAVTLAPFGDVSAIAPGDRVCAGRTGSDIPVSDDMLGRAFDPLGRPVDGGSPLIQTGERWPLSGVRTSPLERVSPTEPLETGVRALDTLLTLGVGQRVGIFAGSGVGKTSLLSTLARHIEAEVCVLCLVGERGREAGEFWSGALSDRARARSTMVVATSDQPAILRARSVLYALAVSEYFRSRGARVLLLLDSVTRYALALREIGLAAGEPPTLRAYTPSVFSALPKVVERRGSLRNGGSITAIMTVLTETDEIDDPMAETMRALLDGHFVLSRTLAEQGHFPAIDVPRSVSRVLQNVARPDARKLAADAVAQLSLYDTSRTLIESGLYVPGAQPALDRAIALRPALLRFLQQASDEAALRQDALGQLARLLESHS